MIYTNVCGVDYIAVGGYREGINQRISRALKYADKFAIQYAAEKMASLVPPMSVIIPIPNHNGIAKENLLLAVAVARASNSMLADILIGKERESNYLMKKRGTPLTEEQMGFRKISDVPIGYTPVIVDGVVDTGTSSQAAIKAIGGRIVLSFTLNKGRLKNNYLNSK